MNSWNEMKQIVLFDNTWVANPRVAKKKLEPRESSIQCGYRTPDNS